MPDPSISNPRQGWLTTLGWAAYLACSWTWCIGMFLPVLLVRDFGIWGFVVFAVPNVLGAAGMGWVLRQASDAATIGEKHATAVRVFSEMTWAFQLFFLMWILESNHNFSWIAVAVIAVALLTSTLYLRPDNERFRAMVRWCGSAALMACVLISPGFEGVRTDGHTLDFRHLGFLAPVCAFGFMLCPYLDATFLKARKLQTPGAARTSFAIGFGLLFAVMIVFTLLYAGQFSGISDPAAFRVPGGLIAGLILIHMGLQVDFTTVAHGTACRGLPGRLKWEHRGVLVALVVISSLLLLHATKGDLYVGLTIGEIAYRLFMACYGLVFPAYVWLCMIPVRGEAGTQRPSRQKLVVLAVAVAAAAPCYWMGFIERQTWWLGPGLMIVLLARLFLRRPPRAAASAT